MVTVVMNTYKDNEQQLRDAISGYQDQLTPCEIIVSTMVGDPAIATAADMGIEKIVINEKPGICGQLNKALEYADGN